MFDIGFWELVLVGIVALLVVGPERLPKMAYEVGLWFGRLQRYLRNARFQIENELHNYEIKNSLEQPTKMLEEIKSEIDQATHDPWVSRHHSNQPPADNSPGMAEAAGKPDDVAGITSNAATDNSAGKTESFIDNGQSKPRT